MPAFAVRAVISKVRIWNQGHETYWPALTTLPDLLVSGFVRTVQGELSELSPLEIVSTQGVCCGGVSALNYAPSQLEPCQKQTALAVAAEFPSRLFKNTQFEA
jgi:3-oxoacyl-[acyl-carrier-protein] synthase-3